MAGYSTTPLAKKLGIKPGAKLLLKGAPEGYLSLVAPLPQGTEIVARFSGEVDVVHYFVTSKKQLASALQMWRKMMGQDAAIWVSWPKKAAKVSTDITDNVIREVALPLGLVDIKVCAVDETWSGLKLVLRRENRRPS